MEAWMTFRPLHKVRAVSPASERVRVVTAASPTGRSPLRGRAVKLSAIPASRSAACPGAKGFTPVPSLFTARQFIRSAESGSTAPISYSLMAERTAMLAHSVRLPSNTVIRSQLSWPALYPLVMMASDSSQR